MMYYIQVETIRAAMNELFDYGRPASITLICLIERSGRETTFAGRCRRSTHRS